MNMKRLHQYLTSSSNAAMVFIALIVTVCLLLAHTAAYAAEDGPGQAKLTRADGDFDIAQFMSLVAASEDDIHEIVFSALLYEGTETCLLCHAEEGRMVLEMGHFKWEGETDRIVGLEGQSHGKVDLINNFCIAVPTNEGRCTQCHAGIGYDDKSFNFDNPANVDCLVCHDHTGTYAKGPKTAGAPDPSVDLNAVARSVSVSSDPTRKSCLSCHAKAGGGDNVKHGDLSTDMVSTTREYDVHMGTDGADFTCTACHDANHDPQTGEVNHGIAGMELHSVYEGEMKQCVDCHSSREAVHAGTQVEENLFAQGWHDRLACQTCHIPAIARKIPTKIEWYWSDAGQDITPPIDPDTGKPTYDKMKGTFVWANNVRPTLRFANDKWNRKVIGVNDKYTSEPIDLGSPAASREDPDAMIYPFKLMIGNQPVDPVTKTVLVPHLFGKKGGDNPYWGKYDWNLALQDGADYTGQDYSGNYSFGMTEMLLSVNHEVAPAEEALGNGAVPDACIDCHTTEHIDWQALGWTDDPLNGGSRD